MYLLIQNTIFPDNIYLIGAFVQVETAVLLIKFTDNDRGDLLLN